VCASSGTARTSAGCAADAARLAATSSAASANTPRATIGPSDFSLRPAAARRRRKSQDHRPVLRAVHRSDGEGAHAVGHLKCETGVPGASSWTYSRPWSVTFGGEVSHRGHRRNRTAGVAANAAAADAARQAKCASSHGLHALSALRGVNATAYSRAWPPCTHVTFSCTCPRGRESTPNPCH